MAGADDAVLAPVTRERVENCLRSATFWVNELPRYADQRQGRADFWAIISGILATLTGLAIFPVLTDTSTDWQKALVSGVAFLAGICALIPRVMNYGELAGQARELTSRYGGVVGDLLDLAKGDPFLSDAARPVVTEFEAVKEKKDSLRGLPDRDTVELRRAETARKLAEARSRVREPRATVAAPLEEPEG
jgi:hypothetical protein